MFQDPGASRKETNHFAGLDFRSPLSGIPSSLLLLSRDKIRMHIQGLPRVMMPVLPRAFSSLGVSPHFYWLYALFASHTNTLTRCSKSHRQFTYMG